jgi:putative acetyltransferase
MITIRAERTEDVDAVRHINQAAFETPAESALVDRLRTRGRLLVSLVAEDEEGAVGHIAFSPVTLDGRPDLRGAGLGPMAGLPRVQKRGIGSQLVRAGLDECRRPGLDYAVVLGHPHYYPRFDFAPASRFGLRCIWPVPDGVFMAIELRAGALAGCAGLIAYEPEFNDV